ncbi:MAG: TetR/AcrR family transcriptional regulator, partial [Methyloceanibacter sp.]
MARTESKKQLILERAFEVATKEGLQGLTIGALASDLKLSKAGLHGHFGTKQELQSQVIDYATQKFMNQVIRPVTTAQPGEPRIRALFDKWLGWYRFDARLAGCFFVSNSAW